MEIETTIAGMERLAPEWERLRARCPEATPFQSPAWAIPWWRAFGVGQLWILTARVGNRLVGLLPLFLQPQPEGGRRLLLIGTGNTDRLDALAEPGFEAELANAAAAHLAELPLDCVEADLGQLPSGSALLRVAPRGWRADCLEGEACLVLPLRRSRLDQVLPHHFGRKLEYHRRRLARSGSVRVEGGEGAPLGALEQLFGEVVRLHAASWSAKDQPGVLAEEWVQRFHREVILAAYDMSLLDLYGLRLNGRMVAGYYGFRDAHCGYYYIGGYDNTFGSLSVGSLIIAEALEQALRRGATRFDFLRGRERYKYRWGAVDSPTVRLRLTR